MRRQKLELHDAAQVRDLGRPEAGQRCLHGTDPLVREPSQSGTGSEASLLDNIGVFGRHLDHEDVGDFEAGAHFVLCAERHQAACQWAWGAHSIAWVTGLRKSVRQLRVQRVDDVRWLQWARGWRRGFSSTERLAGWMDVVEKTNTSRGGKNKQTVGVSQGPAGRRCLGRPWPLPLHFSPPVRPRPHPHSPPPQARTSPTSPTSGNMASTRHNLKRWNARPCQELPIPCNSMAHMHIPPAQ